VASNYKLHSYIRGFGFRQVEVECASRAIGGREIDMMHFVQTAEDWFRVKKLVLSLAVWPRSRFEIRNKCNYRTVASRGLEQKPH
jgi:hypothetical protein